MRRYETALVLGLGASGYAAARLLLAEGARVTVVDGAAGALLSERAAELEKDGARVFLGAESLPAGAVDLCVVSPGVADSSAWARSARASAKEVVSELELGWRRCGRPLLAVTGSNGKSTMVKLCAEILSQAGMKTVCAGNYGPPLCGVAAGAAQFDWAVVEVSSFQLETVADFRPRVGVLLNIHPNHLDRHRDMAAYSGLKMRLFRRMGRGDIAVVPCDASLRSGAPAPAGEFETATFGLGGEATVRYHDHGLHDQRTGSSVSLAGTMFDNEVMGLTAAAALAVAGGCGVSAEVFGRAVGAFRPLPHRMQEVRRIEGVRFVNDSKGTNLAALFAALKMTGGPVRLIAGGIIKEKCLHSAAGLSRSQVRAVYLIGRAMREMADAWSGTVPCELCGSLENAVRAAWKASRPGETVLFSPACASFDQFRGFEERGERFVELVNSLSKEE